MSADEFCEVVVTAPSADWLTDFVRGLVEDRLAAAGHVFPIRSIYRWEGEVHDELESRAALHVRSALVPVIVERAAAEHPYEVPCVVALPIAAGDAAYIQWISDSTAQPGDGGVSV